MVDIRPNVLPAAILPLRSGDALIVDQGTDGVRQTDPFSMTDSVAPVATQAEAVAGSDNTKRMTSLRTKQSIASEVGVTLASNTQGAKADSAVQSVNGKTGNSVTLVKGDVGLGNVDNTSDADKPISTATQTALNLKADNSVTISAGTGLTGGGDLSANRTVSLNSTSVASLAKADSAIQPGDNRLIPSGGSAGQVLGYGDGTVRAWTNAGTGDMSASVYDPSSQASNAFNGFPVATRTAMKSINVSQFNCLYLIEDGREGSFVLKAGSPPVTDAQEGVYVVSNTAGYYWERVYAPKIGPDVNMFGADPSGTADSAPAFQGAANFGGTIIVPSSPYRLNTTITITKSGTKFLGNGPGLSILTIYSTGHGIAVDSGLSYVELEGFRLLRSGVPTSASQNGIHFTGITERARISRVNCEGHWHNFRLCATSLSRVENIFSDNAYGNGIDQTNEDLVAAGMQWEMNYPFIQRSNGYGHRVYSNFGTTSNIATIRGWWSFANKLGGVYVQGQATHPINGCRWIDGFSGEEGSDSMRIDSYGTVDVQISGIQTEINGTLPCGVNNTTPATGVGRGITITANNTNALINGCTALGHSYSGIVNSCPRYTITGCTVRANGKANVSGNRVGIHLAAGHGTCSSNTSWGQQFGIYFEGDTHTIVGNDVSEGNTTPIGGTLTPTNSKIGLNFGSTVITSL